tara:strand:+ start:7344 stop:7640 length:297 start_codon:yes stop_codon:yes gene_type:complete
MAKTIYNNKAIQYVDAINLKRMNRDAIIRKRNRSVDPTYILALIKSHDNINTKFPILFSMIHNDKELRLQIETGVEGIEPIWIDCDIKYGKFIKTMEV